MKDYIYSNGTVKQKSLYDLGHEVRILRNFSILPGIVLDLLKNMETVLMYIFFFLISAPSGPFTRHKN